MFENDKCRYEIRLFNPNSIEPDDYFVIAYGESKADMENCLSRIVDNLRSATEYMEVLLVDKGMGTEETLWEWDISDGRLSNGLY